MLEISKKKMVITRKEHVCHQCTLVIPKGLLAVVATAKEDERHRRLHFHADCSEEHARAMRVANTDIFSGPLSRI